MAQLHVAFHEGFSGDTAIVRVDGVERARKAGLTTRAQIGYADAFDTTIPPGTVRLDVEVVNRATKASQVVDVRDHAYVGVSLDPTGQPMFVVSPEPFRYA